MHMQTYMTAGRKDTGWQSRHEGFASRAGLLLLLVILLPGCSGDSGDAIRFAQECWNSETLLTRDDAKAEIVEVGEISPADTQNGISWRGTVRINYIIYNPTNDAWQDGTSVYNLIRKNDAIQVEHGRPCMTGTSPGMVIP